MTTTITSIAPTAIVDVDTAPGARVWRSGLASGALAAAATCAAVLVARAAGVDVAVDGERIPLDGFAVLTMVGAVIGVALAAMLSRRVRHPRTTFVRTTVALTILSIVPDVVVDATTSTKLVLAATHLIAAAIIVPALAARLSR